MGYDIYGTKKRFRKYDERIHDSDLLPDNKNLAISFKNKVYAAGLMGHHRILKYETFFYHLDDLLGKPFNQATKNDLEPVVATVRGSDWGLATKNDFLRLLKRYYKILYGKEYSVRHPKIVSWIRITREKLPRILWEDVPTWDEINQMAGYCVNPRDRAFIKSIWESGNRIGEHLTLNIADMKPNDHGAYLSLEGKTGCRDVFIRLSVEDLQTWLAFHPGRHNPNNPIFCQLQNGRKPISYKYAEKLLKRLKESAGIEKRITPHRLRHGSVSYFSDFLSDSDMCAKYGWVVGSPMIGRYSHKNLKSIEDKILNLAGVKQDRKSNIFRPVGEKEDKFMAFLRDKMKAEFREWEKSKDLTHPVF